MSKVIVVTNRKGGCGKSTTTASLGAALAKRGKKVLLIDGDSQRSLTISLGETEPENLRVTLTSILSNIISDKENETESVIEPTAGIIHHVEGFDLLAANKGLASIETALVPLMGRELVLKRYIDKVRLLYDYVLIDTPPTSSLLTVNSITAADSVIIPVAPKFLDAKGLELLLKNIVQIQNLLNPNLQIAGILLTMVDTRATFTKKVIDTIQNSYGEQIRVFKNAIPHSIRAVEASATGSSIFAYDPKGKIATAYDTVADELILGGA